jgi:hypothetical protein
MPAIQSWLQSIIVAKDFVHLMFSLMMFTSNVHFKSKLNFWFCPLYQMLGKYIICSKIFIFVLVIVALLPVLCWALDHVARFLRRNFTHSSLYRYVNSKSVICFIVLVHMVDDPIFCHYEHQVVSDFLLSLVQEVLRGPLPMGRDKQHYTQPTLFECWNHPGVSHDHLTFFVRAFTSWRTSICKRFFVCELTSYAFVLLLMQVETQYNSDIYVFSCE